MIGSCLISPGSCLLGARNLTAPIELEVAWHEIHVAIDTLLVRTISGKAVLQITS
jgi:hypothetical protein